MKVRLPMSGGMVPVRWLERRDTPVTRPWSEHARPCHASLHGSAAMKLEKNSLKSSIPSIDASRPSTLSTPRTGSIRLRSALSTKGCKYSSKNPYSSSANLLSGSGSRNMGLCTLRDGKHGGYAHPTYATFSPLLNSSSVSTSSPSVSNTSSKRSRAASSLSHPSRLCHEGPPSAKNIWASASVSVSSVVSVWHGSSRARSTTPTRAAQTCPLTRIPPKQQPPRPRTGSCFEDPQVYRTRAAAIGPWRAG
mmetsp:Transcript_24063/g.59366  ORF Transcript_24063/g.59366 Transcript_24063/m.59366 type:complete len:250 (-) Transcript_24063:33-782(-)